MDSYEPQICPSCSHNGSIPIRYGMPDHDMVIAEQEGSIIVGGVSYYEDSPVHHCPSCGHRWGHLGRSSGSEIGDRTLDDGAIAQLEDIIEHLSADKRKDLAAFEQDGSST